MTSLDQQAPRPGFLSVMLRKARHEPDLAVGLVISAFIAVVVIFPGLFSSQSPLAIDIARSLEAPSALNIFGTDDVGRDVFARIVHGARITLLICAGALAAAAFIGGALGILSGFVGGRLDMLLGRLIDVVLSFPPIILGVMVTGILGPKTANLAFALTVVYVPAFFRIARSGAISEASRSYVEAARSGGLSEPRILVNHVTRNVLPLIMMQCVVLFPLVLQIQSALGFLGLGVQPPTPDWGSILQQGKDYILFAPWMSAFPGFAILITALALMLVSRGVQRRFDRR
ncbi:ABC transporter permease [Phreatobacter aquaticus]|uniref:ABC transporter permease n=1 Tax=Phreatobacter aquaticus TaxID=2570229 RepID=A0A4D7QIA8_9HYPH|nr:ABC transporter permease [Phreatobacter aquaticus]QCK87440.1 ABC transporter permease [Phreatobacter aquaticus]